MSLNQCLKFIQILTVLRFLRPKSGVRSGINQKCRDFAM